MIPHLRQAFNRSFSQSSYLRYLQRMNDAIGTQIRFHMCETPCFVPKELQLQCEQAAVELTIQAHSARCMAVSDAALKPEYTVPAQPPRSLFTVVDFAVARAADGSTVPRLIELQGFPSLLGFQLVQAEMTAEHFNLPPHLTYLNGGHTRSQYIHLLRRAVCADQDPEQVVLLELDPWNQKTSPDFHATQSLLDIGVADIRHVTKSGRTLYYQRHGRTIPIRRIYNRAIVDELENLNVAIPFDWRDDLDVEWAGHPNYYFRISKFLLPLLHHPTVPHTAYLHELPQIPDDLQNYVLKPLYSFAGSGVVVSPERHQVESIPPADRPNYVLQERVEYLQAIDTPHGGTRAELRFMLIWLPDEDQPRVVMNLARMGRGKMMGVRYNQDMPWTGSHCMFFEP